MKMMAATLRVSTLGRGWRASLAAAAMVLAVGGSLQTLTWAQTTAPAVSAANHAAALDAFREARDLYGQEKYADANVQNNKALQLDPSLKDAVLLKKVLQGKLGETGAAARRVRVKRCRRVRHRR